MIEQDMVKLLSARQIRDWDAYTIEHEPISSRMLMERAAAAFADWLYALTGSSSPLHIFCGPGNNGGDGLAAARLLLQRGCEVVVWLADFGQSCSEDRQLQLEILHHYRLPVHILSAETFPTIPANAVVVDGLMGAGLNRPLTGAMAACIHWLNTLPNLRVAIDIPSGLPVDTLPQGPVLKADYTFSFQLPKLSFLLPSCGGLAGQWTVGNIGLLPEALAQLESHEFWVTQEAVAAMLRARDRFSHKGTMGHALLIAGSRGKIGAALLAAEACLRAGAGLLTVHIPTAGISPLLARLPEAMVSEETTSAHWWTVPALDAFHALGVGPGLGDHAASLTALGSLLKDCKKPLVLDADALNMLAQKPSLLDLVPPDTILSPHPKEFERLFGAAADETARIRLLRQQAVERRWVIILKNAYTIIALPNGDLFFNSSGNAGMATAGTGDVLTGLLTGLLARGYKPADAAILGVYLHGLAGDLASAEWGQESLIASDLIDFLGKAFRTLAGGSRPSAGPSL